MVRIRRLAAALAALGLATALSAGAARAQSLQRLTVESFALSSDAAKPQVDVPFHLTVSLHVRERVSAIDNLELPILAELELLGDERRLDSRRDGTHYRETITVVAHRSGTIDIAPATLQAVDARDRRAKQYSTNGLALQVAQAPGEPLAQSAIVAAAVMRFALRAMLWIGGTLCAIAVVVLFFRRRRATPPPQPAATSLAESPPRAIAVQRSPRDDLQDALAVLRAERTRPAAVSVRALVWRMVGASDGETLADVLQRPEAAGRPMRDLLGALERAAFTHDVDVTPAVDDASAALERYLQ